MGKNIRRPRIVNGSEVLPRLPVRGAPRRIIGILRARSTGWRVGQNRVMDRVRMDKWLWAARFFKTRALAAKACELGRIESNDVAAKPAREVKVGDRLRVKAEAAEYTVEVLGLSDMRGPAPVAQLLYRETEASKTLRAQRAEERKAGFAAASWEDGRPSKKDRRDIERWRGRG